MVVKERRKRAEMVHNVVEKSKSEFFAARADLPWLEKLLYATIYLTCFSIGVYNIYVYPFQNEEKLFDFDDGWAFTGRKKDISDFEWNFWFIYVRIIFAASVFQSIGCRFVASYFPEYRLVYSGIFQLAFLSYTFGWKPVLVILGHNVLYYITSRLKSVVLCWVTTGVVLFSFVSSEFLVQLQFYATTGNQNDGDFFLYASMMCQLRGMSFCLDSCSQNTSPAKNKEEDSKHKITYNFMDLLGYNLYLPLFCNGPVVMYNEFHKQINKPPPHLTREVVWSFVFDGLKTIWWYFIMELGFHYLYITSLGRNPDTIRHVSPWLSSALMYCLILLFSVKYVVFYRFGGMFARLDGINPPGIPRCVLNIYTFTEMWKYFDQGLHLWLMKYIYIPLGGSRKGLARQILSSLVTFAFVFYWHGASDYLLYWSILQWCGVFCEAMATKLLKTDQIQHLEVNVLSPAAARRVHAICGVFTITFAILSNCVFLITYEPVVEYVKIMFFGGVWRIPSYLVITYCLVQTIMEVKILIKQDMPSHKKDV